MRFMLLCFPIFHSTAEDTPVHGRILLGEFQNNNTPNSISYRMGTASVGEYFTASRHKVYFLSPIEKKTNSTEQ